MRSFDDEDDNDEDDVPSSWFKFKWKSNKSHLCSNVTPTRDFLEVFPDESKSWDGPMRELANAAEDILEYLVLEKVFLPRDDEFVFHPNRKHKLSLKKVVQETYLKLENVIELMEEFPDENSMKGRITKITNEVRDIYQFYEWEQIHCHFREKWRFLPAECSMFKPKLQFIHHLNKTRNEIDSIMEEVMAMMNDSNASNSSSTLAPVDDIVGFPQDDADASECHRSAKHELQLEKVMEEIALISAKVKNIKVSSSSIEVQHGADSSSQSSSDSSTLSYSSTAPPIQNNFIIGLEDHARNIKDRLCGNPSKLQVIPVCGMGGIGKTTLARNVYDDKLIAENFPIRVWVTISQDYSAERILSDLLESLERNTTTKVFSPSEEHNNKGGKEEDADKKVYQLLMGRKYLVVMDDIWRSEAWDIVRNVFPDNVNGSRIMLTTRLYDVASYPGPSIKPYELGFLTEDQSWNLLKEKVFANQDCPSNLEYIGKNIARSCKGLPLAIVVIAGLLATVTKNPASWMEIAEMVKSAKTAEQEHIEEILSLSYVDIPQLLRPCFLYMGSFPEDHEIHTTKLIRLWIAEGFLKFPINTKSFEEVAEECLEELVKRNLVFVTKRKSDGRVKSCSLHDLIRELCIRKAQESKFFLNLMDEDIEKEKFMESIKNERRMRVLDAEAADVESLPSPLFELFHLRYLAIDIGEIYFDYPEETTCPLENLHTVSYVESACCSEEILKRIPNLKKLKVDCSHGRDAGCLNDLSYSFAFPEMLKKLTLRDLKLPWNDMIVVGSLPNLQVLKLKGCTCSGGTWETTEGTFPVLEVLLVQGSGFKNWITESGHFPMLKRLLLHSCWISTRFQLILEIFQLFN
ncbi:disease resistance protein RPP13-like [Salvia hispanica]|uniref:disease resistance protein RPP13-like n=1 Tax=Salvia hispanica TaxID=49212 RepID=UPI002008F4A6|nr:disease resistance protein RPP13-like [Salvia hispanica]